jgi:SAM-dependent methyltransferase
MEGNIERFGEFAKDYHSVRPSPPAILKSILLELAKTARLKLVVDIGSGTGLSTRYWVDVADRVIGIEPNDNMRSQATATTHGQAIEFRKGLSSDTGLQAGTADLVTCSQALHWMEPKGTFPEVARILRAGGVFAAYDYDWPPTTGVWEADQAYVECMKGLDELERKRSAEHMVHKWEKHEHLGRMEESKCFRFTKEIVVHHTETGNAERFIGILLSQGGVRLLLKSGYKEQQLGIDKFRDRCRDLLGEKQKEWYWSSRVRVGVK